LKLKQANIENLKTKLHSRGTRMKNSSDSWNNLLLQESELSRMLKITAYSILLFLSFTGNTIIIAIIYKNANRRMRAASNLFIFNMAISNLLLTVWNVPLSLKGLASDYEWCVGGTLGSVLCKFCMFLWFLSELVSTGSLSAISFDRFLLVYYPTKNFLNKRMSALTITLSWILAIAFSVPVFVYTNTIEYKGKLYCFMNLGSERTFAVFAIVTFAVFIATPLITVSVLYFAIIIKLLGQKPVGENVNNQRLEKKRKENCRICVMLLIIVFLFVLCVLPYWTAYLYCIVGASEGTYSVCSSFYFQIAFLFTFVNAGANPYIYLLFSQSFKKGAKNLICKVPLNHEASTSIDHVKARTNRVSTRASTADL
jgi:hypothetical protein